MLPTDLSGWLCHLESLHPRGQAGIELGLERIRQVQAALKQQQTCPVITVAGTNGKGSTCAYLENILCRAAYRVGCYTSPHLLAYNERVRLNGQPVPDASLCAAFARVEQARQAAGDVRLTYFEFGTLAAWEVFAAADVEAIILEVGLGGRLDAVNLYDADVAIVTGIALDHTDWLGPTRDTIGQEKAGIFRTGKPAFCADPQPPASLTGHAEIIGADLRLIGRDFGFDRDAENRAQWRYWNREGGQVKKRILAYPGLRGGVQLFNASVALAALDALHDRLPLPSHAIRNGLIETELPGRFQVLPGRPAVVLDVGHNPQAVAVLADNLSGMGFFEHTHVVLGMLADKDVAAALQPLRNKVSSWQLATLTGPRGTPAAHLAAMIEQEKLGGTTTCHDTPAGAFAAAQKNAGENDRIVVFGSFHTIAGVSDLLRCR